MHISEGILSGQVLITTSALSAVGFYLGFKKLDYDLIPQTGILAAVFFVASLVHVPLGPGNVHLVLNGIIGLLLGWKAFPAIMVALMLQAILFQFGGITTLGVNTLIMALPAIICYFIFSPMLHKYPFPAAFACGFLSVLLSALLAAGALLFTEGDFFKIASILIMAHIPIMIIEGTITGFLVIFIKKVRPEMLISKPE